MIEKIFCKKLANFIPQSRQNVFALDIACGLGEYSKELAKNGWNVMSVDMNKKFQDYQNIKFFEIDLEKDIDKLFIQEPFNRKYDLIIKFKYLNRPLLRKLPSILKSDGVLMIETFMIGNENLGRPKNLEFLLQKNELKSLYKKNLKLMYFKQGKRHKSKKESIMQTAVFKKIKIDTL